MIRKPADGWGRESAAVGAVRNAAAGGQAAARAGGRLVRGAYLCAIGGVFLFGGLASGLLGGNMPSLIGCGVVGSVLVGAGMRAFKASPGSVETPMAVAAGAGAGPPGAVDYSRGKLLTQAGLAVLVLAVSAGVLGHTGGMLRIVMTILIPVFGLVAFASARKAFGDLAALRWDARGVTVADLFNRHNVPWSSVRSISIEQINTYAYGFVKVASRRILTIRRADGPMFAKRLSLRLDLLDLKGRAPEHLVLALQAAQLGRPASAPVSAPAPEFHAPQPPPRYAPPPPTRAAAPVAPRHDARPDVPLRPAAYGADPVRATFGRRGA